MQKKPLEVQNSRKLKGLVVGLIDISRSWGPAIHLAEVWQAMSKDQTIEFVMYSVKEGLETKPYRTLDFPVKVFSLVNRKFLKFMQKNLLSCLVAFKVIKDRNALDFVYIRLCEYCIPISLAARFCRLPLVIEANGLASEDNAGYRSKIRSSWAILSESIACRSRRAHIIAVSKLIGDELAHRYQLEARQISIIGNGCSSDLRNTHADMNGSGELVLAYLGTFTPWDGHGQFGALIEIFNSIRKSRLVIGGRPVCRNKTFESLVSHPLVTYQGEIEYTSLRKFYSQADCGIVLYDFQRHSGSGKVETSSLKVMEYAASGLPILATDVRGLEWIREADIGMLLSAEDLENDRLLKERVEQFLKRFDDYKKNLSNWNGVRTWNEVALETNSVLLKIVKFTEQVEQGIDFAAQSS